MIEESLPFQPGSAWSVTVFLTLNAVVVATVLMGVFIAYRKADPGSSLRKALVVALLCGLWVGLLSALVSRGTLQTLPLFGLPFFFGAILLVSVLAGFSPAATAVARHLPLGALVGFQAFRLPLELVLHEWSRTGTIPQTMTWTGQNLDIGAGIVALLAAPFAARRPGVAWGANVVGVLLLLNVVRVAVMSSPLPFAWGVMPPLVLAWHMPYALIGPICVGGALAGHVVLTRALLQRERATTPTSDRIT